MGKRSEYETMSLKKDGWMNEKKRKQKTKAGWGERKRGLVGWMDGGGIQRGGSNFR